MRRKSISEYQSSTAKRLLIRRSSALVSLAALVTPGIWAGWTTAVSARPIQQETTQSTQQEQQDKSRQIIRDEFTRARPSPTPDKRQTPPRTGNRPTAGARPRYKRKTPGPVVTTSPRPPVGTTEIAGTMEIGITIWRLRPSSGNDAGARVLVMEKAQTSQWTPERVEADTQLRVGERVRISVESPRAGYLYVIDREQHADGSLGAAYLIFPTTRTRGGDNQVRPGRLIDIPAQEDNPSYFTLTPTAGRSDQVAEVLTFIVTAQPLEGLPISDNPLRVSNSDVAKWETTWSSEVERFEMEGGLGLTWTAAEKEAGSTTSGRLLTQEEPAPQTIYRISSKSKNSFLVTVPLRYGR